MENNKTNLKWLETMEFGIDWINGILDYDGSIFDFFNDISLFDDRLRVDNWVLMNGGKYHYNNCFWLNGNASVQVCWNCVEEETQFIPCKEGENNNHGIFISISGDGVRFLQQHVNTLGSLFKYLFNRGFRCSRFDVNCDIYERDNPLIPVLTEAFRWALIRKQGELGLATHVQRKTQNFQIYELYDTVHEERVYNLQLGCHSSRFGMFRCYNKWLELTTGRLSTCGTEILNAKGNPDYWYRLEYELHKENARDIFNAFASGRITLENAFYAAADKVFRVVNQGYLYNKFAQDKTNEIWEEFLEYIKANSIHFVELTQIYNTTPYVPKSLLKMQSWLQHIAKAFYVASELQAASPEWFEENVIRVGKERVMKDGTYKQVRHDILALYNDQDEVF